MITLIVHDALFRGIYTTGQGMTAWSGRAMIFFAKVLNPARTLFFCPDCRFKVHSLMHSTIERTIVAIIGVVAKPEIYDTRLHPNTLILHNLEH